ncbi:MAG: helix-turn-helix transcriptional regulator [Oscillospiraceae bacterium]|nr:helix-turn-helix transcriptional regulator [Oscillospiraceae bacterium]
MSLGENIRQARKAAGISQEELGAALGVVSQTVSKWERDESSPDAALLPELAKALGISLDRLFGLALPDKALEEAFLRALRPKTEAERSDLLLRLWRLYLELNIGMLEGEESISYPDMPRSRRYAWREKGELAFFRSSPALPAAFLFREPEEGYASLFEASEEKRLLWEALGDPETLRAAKKILSTPSFGIVEAAAVEKLLELEDPERTIPLLQRLGLLYFDKRIVDGREAEVGFFTPLPEPLALLCLGEVLYPDRPAEEMFVTGGGWHFVPFLCDGPLPVGPLAWYAGTDWL